MAKYSMRELQAEDMQQIAAIYNSNQTFLKNHHGTGSIGLDFIRQGGVSLPSDAGTESAAAGAWSTHLSAL